MVSVGIIGTGFGQNVMAPAYESAGARVMEVVSARDDDAIAAMLARDDLDLISVHSPPALHARHVHRVLEAGRTVLCDKPVGMNLAETEGMARLARERGLRHHVNFEFRALPSRVALRDAIAAGEIGDVERISWTYPYALTRDPVWPHRWLFDRQDGGGWLGGWGVHAIDALHWLGFTIEGVQGTLQTIVDRRPDGDGEWVPSTAEDGFSVVLDLGAGRTATIDSSFGSAVSLPQRLVVHGSAGALELIGDRELVLWQPGAEPRVVFSLDAPDPIREAVRCSVANLVAAVASESQSGPCLDDAVRVDDVIERLRALPRTRVGFDPAGV